MTVSLNRSTLNDIIAGKTTLVKATTAGDVKIDGATDKLQEFLGLLDKFDPWYNVVTPVAAKE